MFLINLLGFDFLWFGLVFWGNIFTPCAILFLCLHFYFISNNRRREFFLVTTVALIGIIVDSTLHLIGVFIFPETSIIPIWLVTLWLCFGATLCHSLNFLQHSKVLQCLVGAFLAPLSYLAGKQLNVVSFSLSNSQTFMVLAFIWGLLMLLFFTLKSHLVKEEINYA
ncbi:DUF2878 domain-containing protein [Colwelliaceae bacterium MEBiC 14330]